MNRATLLVALLALAPVGPVSAQVKLEAALPDGVRTIKTVTHSRQVLTIAGMELPTEADSTSTTRQTVEPRAADGTRRVRHKGEAMTLRIAAPGGMNLNFDSSKPEEKAEVAAFQPLVDAYRALAKAEVVYVVDKAGKLASVEEPRHLLTTLPQSTADQIRDELDPAELKKSWEREAARLPDLPVNKGDRWKRSEVLPIGSGQSMQLETYYEYVGTTEKAGKTYDQINVLVTSVRYEIDDKSPLPVRSVRSDLKVESCTGSLLLDRATGVLTDSTMALRIKGNLTLSINGMELPSVLDLSIDLSVENRP